jgi:uncharacterized protein YjiK
MKFHNSLLSVATRLLVYRIAVGIFALAVPSALCAQDGTLYGIDISRNLVEIDLEGQKIAEIGEIGEAGTLFRGLTYHPPTGELFGIGVINDDHKLVRISRNTGLGSVVGSIGVDNVRTISFAPSSGGFYATSTESLGGPSSLLHIDAETGAGEIIGDTGFLGFLGLAYDGQDNLLFGTAAPAGEPSGTELVVIDPATGDATARGAVDTLTVGAPVGLTYDPFSDQLLLSVQGFADPLGFSNENQEIYGIDKLSGELASFTRFTINDRILALAFVPNAIPEPASSSFLMLGFVGTLLRRNRRSDATERLDHRRSRIESVDV